MVAHATPARRLESIALGLGTLAFVVTALVALPVFRLESAPISGPGSVGQYAAIASAVAALLAFVAGRYVVRARSGRRVTFLDVLDIAALAIAHGIIALLSWTLIAVILEQSFLDAQVFAVPLLVVAGAAAAVTAYAAFLSSAHMNLDLLAIVLAVFLVEGILASMLTASDPHWWRINLSALGATDDLSALAFNITLIVAGFIVTTLTRYATRGIPGARTGGGIVAVRICLVLVGVFLACVGIFPVDEFLAVHNTVASGMAVTFGVLVIGLARWIPGLSRAFLGVGYVFLGVVVALAIAFFVGYYTLTAVELVAGILVFAWIILFIRSAAALAADAAPADAEPEPVPIPTR
ncbi:DUF998 domain-containing protein [Microbacterium sp. X-17]|uniref:DUF998 domain-containing protein n=1 Tax=Microbacterium sp. X-17 TaxID=3144404 RepID=UPI0031F5B61E